jgi:hypothetical protein
LFVGAEEVSQTFTSPNYSQHLNRPGSMDHQSMRLEPVWLFFGGEISEISGSESHLQHN